MRLEFNLSKVDLKNEDWRRALARMVGVDDLSEPPLSFVSGRVLWVDFLSLWELKAQNVPLKGSPLEPLVLARDIHSRHGCHQGESQVALTVHIVRGKKLWGSEAAEGRRRCKGICWSPYFEHRGWLAAAV